MVIRYFVLSVPLQTQTYKPYETHVWTLDILSFRPITPHIVAASSIAELSVYTYNTQPIVSQLVSPHCPHCQEDNKDIHICHRILAIAQLPAGTVV